MGFVKDIPVVGTLLAGPEKLKAPKAAPVPEVAPVAVEPEEPTLIMEDLESETAKQRKRRASAAAQQSGLTVLGTGTEGLGGSRTPGG